MPCGMIEIVKFNLFLQCMLPLLGVMVRMSRWTIFLTMATLYSGPERPCPFIKFNQLPSLIFLILRCIKDWDTCECGIICGCGFVKPAGWIEIVKWITNMKNEIEERRNECNAVSQTAKEAKKTS